MYVVKLLNYPDEYYCFDDNELDYIRIYGRIPETVLRLDISTIQDVENCDIFQEKLGKLLYNKYVPEVKIRTEVIDGVTVYNTTEPFYINGQNNAIKISGLIMCLGVYLVNTVNGNIVGFHYETVEDDKEKRKLDDSVDLITSWGDNFDIIIYRLPNKKYSDAQDISISIIENFYGKNAQVIEVTDSSVIYPPIQPSSFKHISSRCCNKCDEQQYILLGPHPTISHNRKVREFIKYGDREEVEMSGFV